MECQKCRHHNPDDSKFCAKCGQGLENFGKFGFSQTETFKHSQEELTTGSTFAGRYQIIEELGRGGMGHVYKAFDTKIKEKIALKLIRPEIAADKKTIERFNNELKLARKIGHRHVGKMFHLEEEKGARYITMEYVPGEDLRSMIRMSGQLGIGTAVNIVRQLCEGLSEAHRLGVIHRDLKPSNIMIDKHGQAKIMDFGIARSLQAKSKTGPGMMIGTPAYMSPEQVESGEVDQRSDIYSLGIILYEMLTGRTPFEGDTPFSIGIKHKNETPENPKTYNARIPDDLSHIVLKCLEKEKANRFQSTGEICSRLNQIEQGIPTAERECPAKKTQTSREITLSLPSRKIAIPAAIAVVMIFLWLFVWNPFSKKPSPPAASGKPRLAVLYFENISGSPELEKWRSGIPSSMNTDLSQSRHIFVLTDTQTYSLLKKLDLDETTKYTQTDLEKIAAEGRIDYLVYGNFISAGKAIEINYHLYKSLSSDRPISQKTTCRDDEDVLTQIDPMTKRIKQALELTPEQISADIDEDTADILTGSPEALDYYGQSRKFYNLREYEKTIKMAQKAIEVDPNFAMAYRTLASVNYAIGFRDKEKTYLKKALDLSDRLSIREQYIIQASYYGAVTGEMHHQLAQDALQNLLGLYPDDLLGHELFAYHYFDLEEEEKALQHYDTVRMGGVRSSRTNYTVMMLYNRMGWYEKSEALLKDYIQDHPDEAKPRLDLAFLYTVTGKYDLARYCLEEAFVRDPTQFWYHIFLGDIHLFEGDLEEADKIYLSVLQQENPTGKAVGYMRYVQLLNLQGRINEIVDLVKGASALADQVNESGWKASIYQGLAWAEMFRGNYDAALEILEDAEKISLETQNMGLQIEVLKTQGRILVEAGKLTEAAAIAEKLKTLLENHSNKKLIRDYYFLRGRIELKHSNFQKAVDNFTKSLSFLRSGSYASGNLSPTDKATMSHFLGRAYFGMGDLEKAAAALEEMKALNHDRINCAFDYAKNYNMLGQVYEKKGDLEKAIANYTAFTELWESCDPVFQPQVEEARRRIAALQQKR